MAGWNSVVKQAGLAPAALSTRHAVTYDSRRVTFGVYLRLSHTGRAPLDLEANMSNPLKSLLSVAAGLAIGLLFGSASSRGAEASARAAAAHAAVTATLPQRGDSVACHHEEPSRWVGCDWFFSEGTIRTVTLNVTTTNDEAYQLSIRTGRPDAIFLTRDAALRFLAPYYCCENPERAVDLARLRATISASRILSR